MLLDTHALIWAATGDARLTPAALSVLEDPSNERLLSAVTALEIAIKHSVGRLDLPQQPDEYIKSRSVLFKLTPLVVTIEHAVHVATLPHSHRDPFDRLLVAQSQVERVPIVTGDPEIAAYDVQTIW